MNTGGQGECLVTHNAGLSPGWIIIVYLLKLQKGKIIKLNSSSKL
jgi:hypothetical protein